MSDAMSVDGLKKLLFDLLVYGAGLTIAAAVVAGLYSLPTQDWRGVPFAFWIAFFLGAVLGLPLFFATKARGRVNAKTAVACGFAVGAALPVLVMAFGGADQASINGVPTVVDGRYTWRGWVENIQFVALTGGLGSIGALIFMTVVKWRNELSASVTTAHWTRGDSVAAFSAVAIFAAVFFISDAYVDRSCHNILRDGRRSATPAAQFELRADRSAWREVEAELENYGREAGFDMRPEVRPDDDFLPWFQVSLCREPGTNIFVSQAIGPRLSFAVFQEQGDERWRTPFQTLHERVKRRWPGRVFFTGGQGEEIAPPAWSQFKGNAATRSLPPD